MSEFSYDDVVRSYHLAHADGLEPTQLHLGYEQTQALLSDANFTTASSMGQTNAGSSIGVVAGIDVQQAQIPHLKVMTAQQDDELAYYLL